MRRMVYEPGEHVQWPNTALPAESTGRSVEVADTIVQRHKSGRFYVKYLYKNLVDRLAEDMHSNIANDYDNVILVEGGEGKGKSNVSLHVAKTFDPDFDMRKSLVYQWKSFLKSVLSDNPQKVYWFDEAALVASNREWNKEENIMLYKSVQVVRSLRLVLIFDIPSINAIDNYIRNFRTRYLISAKEMAWSSDRVKRRGYAELSFALTEEERKAIPKDSPSDKYYRSIGFFEFPQMSPEDKAIYDELKAGTQKRELAGMLKILEEKEEGGSRYRRDKRSLEALVSYMADVQGLSYQDIADISGMPYNTVKGMAWRKRNEGDQ